LGKVVVGSMKKEPRALPPESTIRALVPPAPLRDMPVTA
jgi:hypothetical protein